MIGIGEPRFDSKIKAEQRIAGMTPCWIWGAGDNGNGYGTFWDGKVKTYAHRHAFLAVRGNIPPGTEIDHTCRVRRCCNPEHLAATTHRENARRRAVPDACPMGHPYTAGNLMRAKSGSRYCARCNRAQAQAWRDRMKKDPERYAAYHEALYKARREQREAARRANNPT